MEKWAIEIKCNLFFKLTFISCNKNILAVMVLVLVVQ